MCDICVVCVVGIMYGVCGIGRDVTKRAIIDVDYCILFLGGIMIFKLRLSLKC